MDLLDEPIPTPAFHRTTFLNLIELIDVRVYKTRGTDPKADIARFTHDISKKSVAEIESWLLWFNNRWMSKDEFQAAFTANIYGNRSLNYVFINYCEFLRGSTLSIEELKDISNLNPNIEHILSQTPNFDPVAFGFTNDEDYINYEHRIGNLSILEKNFNSSIQNKAAIDKVETYDRSKFVVMQEVGSQIYSQRGFTKTNIMDRTKILAEYCSARWCAELGLVRYAPTNAELENEPKQEELLRM